MNFSIPIFLILNGLLIVTNNCFAQRKTAAITLSELTTSSGIYSVGYQNYIRQDKSRTYSKVFHWDNKKINRPISISLWYPALKNEDDVAQMKVIDYLQIMKEEYEWENLPNEQILNWFDYPNSQSNRKHLNEITQSVRDAIPVKGKFPVVIYAPSLQASGIENFALCEQLASHGYLVIACPSRGAENKYLKGGSTQDLESQSRDLEFLIQEVKNLKIADENRIATMGFSFGGLSNVLTQMKNESIKAIVSLDGSIKYQYEKLKKSAFYQIDKVDVPFIHFAQKNIPIEVIKSEGIDPTLDSVFKFYDDLKYSNAYQLKMNDLTHPYFSTLGVLFKARDLRQDKPDQQIVNSYNIVCNYTLQFLNAYMKSDYQARSFIDKSPVKNNISNELVSYQKKVAIKKPFTFRDFNELASVNEYNELNKLFQKLKKENKIDNLPEVKLNNLGLQLLYDSSTSKSGIKVLEFATEIHPNSANLFDSLAEGYLYLNNKSKAIKAFEEILNLDPDNAYVKERIESLK